MNELKDLLDGNKAWAERVKKENPHFFETLSKQQAPEYLWIGCSDSRVPANEIVGLLPGELLVHRNVANLVIHTDLNCLSVLQYAVDVLKVRHVIVCGHYGCGGVKAAMGSESYGLIDNWLRHLKDVYQKYAAQLDAITDDHARLERFCELNIIEQVRNVCQTTVVQEAWQRGQEVSVHGLAYSLEDGLLRDLRLCISCAGDLSSATCSDCAR